MHTQYTSKTKWMCSRYITGELFSLWVTGSSCVCCLNNEGVQGIIQSTWTLASVGVVSRIMVPQRHPCPKLHNLWIYDLTWLVGIKIVYVIKVDDQLTLTQEDDPGLPMCHNVMRKI